MKKNILKIIVCSVFLYSCAALEKGPRIEFPLSKKTDSRENQYIWVIGNGSIDQFDHRRFPGLISVVKKAIEVDTDLPGIHHEIDFDFVFLPVSARDKYQKIIYGFQGVLEPSAEVTSPDFYKACVMINERLLVKLKPLGLRKVEIVRGSVIYDF